MLIEFDLLSVVAVELWLFGASAAYLTRTMLLFKSNSSRHVTLGCCDTDILCCKTDFLLLLLPFSGFPPTRVMSGRYQEAIWLNSKILHLNHFHIQSSSCCRSSLMPEILAKLQSTYLWLGSHSFIHYQT